MSIIQATKCCGLVLLCLGTAFFSRPAAGEPQSAVQPQGTTNPNSALLARAEALRRVRLAPCFRAMVLPLSKYGGHMPLPGERVDIALPAKVLPQRVAQGILVLESEPAKPAVTVALSQEVSASLSLIIEPSSTFLLKLRPELEWYPVSKEQLRYIPNEKRRVLMPEIEDQIIRHIAAEIHCTPAPVQAPKKTVKKK